jgi:predicted phage baseplate assembly protein
LTYVSAPTPSGIASTLQIRVNSVAWQEAPTFYGLSAGDHAYVVRVADDGTPSVTFGNRAARLRTGQQNVSAVYRTGIGLVGNVAAGALAVLQSRQPGLRGVTNPLPATGGAEAQRLADARSNAPLTVLTLDRIVSLDDYQAFAQAFPGVGKAQAVAVWSGTKYLVYITIGSADGQPIDSSWPLYQTLVQAIAQAHDPVQHFAVAGFQPLVFNLKAGLLIDRPAYDPAAVMAAVSAALTEAFLFANRSFAQAVTAAEIVTLMQAVAGVAAVYLTQLYLTSDPTGPAQAEPSAFLLAMPARWQGGRVQPAQLLLLNPLGVTLTEVTS